jgi:hypothetical protein
MVQMTIVEHAVVAVVEQMLSVIRNDEELMGKVIVLLWQKCASFS